MKYIYTPFERTGHWQFDKKLIKQHNICHDRYNFQDGSICIILEFREKLIHHILLGLLEFFTLIYENDSMLKGMIVIASAHCYIIKSCYFQQHCVIIGRKSLYNSFVRCKMSQFSAIKGNHENQNAHKTFLFSFRKIITLFWLTNHLKLKETWKSPQYGWLKFRDFK